MTRALAQRQTAALAQRQTAALARRQAPVLAQRQAAVLRAAMLVFAVATSGCATVAQNRRARLADPMMSVTDEPLDAYRRQKLYDTREGAAGGDGAAAGGGCGCQ